MRVAKVTYASPPVEDQILICSILTIGTRGCSRTPNFFIPAVFRDHFHLVFSKEPIMVL